MFEQQQIKMIGSDSGVMTTNDDATVCKRYAVSLGYWRDIYIDSFFHNKHPSRLERKTPEINRGYYARVQAIENLVDQFLNYVQCLNEEESSSSTTSAKQCVKCQIVNLGCGFDTLYWRLKAGDEKCSLLKAFIDLDLDGITYKKLHQIRTKPDLLNALGREDISFNQYDLHSNVYHLVSADLRNIKQLEEKLFNNCKLDRTLPTLFISECVLVYISKQHTENLLNWITSNFQQPVFVNYEQVNMTDKFGEIMIDNLRARDCEIMDLESCRSLDKQEEKFLNSGFTNANASTMQTIYTSCIDQLDRERIERIEFLDEANLLEQLLNHYSITVAYKGFTSPEDEDEIIFGF